jgi:hypothetical protein
MLVDFSTPSQQNLLMSPYPDDWVDISFSSTPNGLEPSYVEPWNPHQPRISSFLNVGGDYTNPNFPITFSAAYNHNEYDQTLMASPKLGMGTEHDMFEISCKLTNYILK